MHKIKNKLSMIWPFLALLGKVSIS